MVAAQQQQPDLAFDDFTQVVGFIGGQHQRFDGGGERHTQQLGHGSTGALARRGGLDQRLAGGSARSCRGQRLGFFHVGGVTTVWAINDGVFARGGNHLKFLTQVATNGTTVGSHGAVGQAKAVKDAAVGLRHGLVADLCSGSVTIKAVGVFHGEFAPAHQAKARPALVAELGLDLVEVFGQLLVAAQFLTRNVGHYFFAGGLHDVVAPVAVFDAQQLRAHLFKAAGFLPQLGRLHHRHGQLDRTSSVHFLAHDGFNLAHDTQAHRHVGIDAGAQLFDEPGAGHELVADHFCVGRSLFEGGNKELGSFHRCNVRPMVRVPLLRPEGRA